MHYPLNIDFAEQSSSLEQMRIVMKPNVAGRDESTFPESAPNAKLPQTGADIIKDYRKVKNGWNMMLLMGGSSFDKNCLK